MRYVNQAKIMERARDTQFYPHCVVYVYGGGGGAGWQRVGGQPRVWYMYVASRLYGSETIVCMRALRNCVHMCNLGIIASSISKCDLK